MLVTVGSIFEHVRNNLASIAARRMGDGIVVKCDVSCLCVDGTLIRDVRPERDGCGSENVSEKGARSTECGTAAYLPEDTTGTGTTFDHNLSTVPGRNRAANLKYVDAFPIECQSTSGSDLNRRGEVVHTWCKCLPC